MCLVAPATPVFPVVHGGFGTPVIELNSCDRHPLTCQAGRISSFENNNWGGGEFVALACTSLSQHVLPEEPQVPLEGKSSRSVNYEECQLSKLHRLLLRTYWRPFCQVSLVNLRLRTSPRRILRECFLKWIISALKRPGGTWGWVERER